MTAQQSLSSWPCSGHSRPETKTRVNGQSCLHHQICGLGGPEAHTGHWGWGGDPAWRRSVCGSFPDECPVPRGPPPWSLWENGDGARGHPSPSRAQLKCQPQRRDTEGTVGEQGPSVGVGCGPGRGCSNVYLEWSEWALSGQGAADAWHKALCPLHEALPGFSLIQ